MLVEDEALIALDLQDALQDAGYRIGGPFSTCSAALDWLRTFTPSVAILDAVVRDGPCREIAHELTRRAVPFLVYSGHREREGALAWGGAPWIEKPVGSSALVEACDRLANL